MRLSKVGVAEEVDSATGSRGECGGMGEVAGVENWLPLLVVLGLTWREQSWLLASEAASERVEGDGSGSKTEPGDEDGVEDEGEGEGGSAMEEL